MSITNNDTLALSIVKGFGFVDPIVKVLEGFVHFTVIFAVIAAVWTFYKLTETNRAKITITIINDFGYTIKVHCPEAVDHSDWLEIGDKGLRKFTFDGNLFGTHTKWCHIKFEENERRFKIYKADDPKDDEFICRITTHGIYIDEQERMKWNWEKEIKKHDARVWESIPITLQTAETTTGPFSSSNTTEHSSFLGSAGTAGPSSSSAMKISLLTNDGQKVTIDRDGALIHMSKYLSDMFSDNSSVKTTKERSFQLNTINKDVLCKVIEWCEHHKDDLEIDWWNETPLLGRWDDEFLALGKEMILEIMEAAIILELKGLNYMSRMKLFIPISEGKYIPNPRYF